ncbi:MAG: hypothetical protein REI96_10905 [Flavobacterium nitrogenifigens]|uniref:hypothetical protein n=1 Tax=Flavobacterium nitrogenifigens TaxID=1617283 RepID=UPI002807AC2A|nr:hypothetical protein [Flavobacterium nitrogenifigens]MDQ8012949.1 hypothetical protein [Flavobacterium nitrogenifigens]
MIFITELKSISAFIKKNLSIIIIIPAFIGGAWQALELMNISVQYIRFFSISQIVPDGLVILMSLLVGVLPSIVSMAIGFYYGKNKNENATVITNSAVEQEGVLKEFIFLNKIIFLLAVLLSFSWHIALRKFDNINGDLSKFSLYIMFAIVILNSAYQSMDNLNDCNKVVKVSDLFIVKFSYFIIVILVFISISGEVHNNFLLTKNFINIENVKSEIDRKFPNGKNEILYFNDKYIFFNIKFEESNNKNTEKIYIQELNEMFKNSDK